METKMRRWILAVATMAPMACGGQHGHVHMAGGGHATYDDDVEGVSVTRADGPPLATHLVRVKFTAGSGEEFLVSADEVQGALSNVSASITGPGPQSCSTSNPGEGNGQILSDGTLNMSFQFKCSFDSPDGFGQISIR